MGRSRSVARSVKVVWLLGYGRSLGRSLGRSIARGFSVGRSWSVDAPPNPPLLTVHAYRIEHVFTLCAGDDFVCEWVVWRPHRSFLSNQCFREKHHVIAMFAVKEGFADHLECKWGVNARNIMSSLRSHQGRILFANGVLHSSKNPRFLGSPGLPRKASCHCYCCSKGRSCRAVCLQMPPPHPLLLTVHARRKERHVIHVIIISLQQGRVFVILLTNA